MGEPVPVDGEQLVEVPVDVEFYTVGIPRLSRPIPHESRAANECADGNEDKPDGFEANQKSPNCMAARFIGVVAISEWIRVNKGNGHQADDNERGNDDAGDPRV